MLCVVKIARQRIQGVPCIIVDYDNGCSEAFWAHDPNFAELAALADTPATEGSDMSPAEEEAVREVAAAIAVVESELEAAIAADVVSFTHISELRMRRKYLVGALHRGGPASP